MLKYLHTLLGVKYNIRRNIEQYDNYTLQNHRIIF